MQRNSSGAMVAAGGAVADDVNLATQVGRTFELFDGAGVTSTGAFAVFSLYVWNLSNIYTNGGGTLVAVPESGGALLVAGALTLIPYRRRRTIKPKVMVTAIFVRNVFKGVIERHTRKAAGGGPPPNRTPHRSGAPWVAVSRARRRVGELNVFADMLRKKENCHEH